MHKRSGTQDFGQDQKKNKNRSRSFDDLINNKKQPSHILGVIEYISYCLLSISKTNKQTNHCCPLKSNLIANYTFRYAVPVELLLLSISTTFLKTSECSTSAIFLGNNLMEQHPKEWHADQLKCETTELLNWIHSPC